MNTTTFVDKITHLERMPSSRYGNPRFLVSFAEHGAARTEPDAGIAYGIENSEYRLGRVEVTLNGRGHVTYLEPVTGPQITTRYHSDPTSGAGKITAHTVVDGKRRQLTVEYDHAAYDAHESAALALAQKLGYGAVSETGKYGSHTYSTH